jgi:hypothetical protein
MDHALIAREYPILRSAGVTLSQSLVKQLTGEDIQQAARDLGMLHGKTISFETEGEASVLMDYAIHDIRHDGFNLVDRFLRDQPPAEGSIEHRLLRSLQHAQFALFTVTSVEPGLGVYGDSSRSVEPCFLADVGFSKTAVPGVIFASRLHAPYDDWYITTGAPLPLNEETGAAIVDEIKAYRQKNGVGPDGRDFSLLVIRACLAHGASHSVRYGPVAANQLEHGEAFGRALPRIGRNDPCPCGSGKKYKKCCGR